MGTSASYHSDGKVEYKIGDNKCTKEEYQEACRLQIERGEKSSWCAACGHVICFDGTASVACPICGSESIYKFSSRPRDLEDA